MQDELEPIWHSTEHDESDDIEQSKLAEGELTEFEKSEVYRKLEKEEGLMTGDINSEEDVALVNKRSVWGNSEADYTDGYWQREFKTFEGDILNGWEEDGGPSLEVIEDHATGQRTVTILKDEEPEEVEWRIVELPNGGFIRRPFPVKKAVLAGPDEHQKAEKYFRKGEKWEHKYKNEV